MLGGRTNHWGRISLRFGPDDFRRRSLDGLGDDWPISYDDIKPFYDRVDDLIGIFGTVEGLPNEPDGHLPAAAAAALLRAAHQAGLRRDEDHVHPVAAVDPHAGAQRPRPVSLLRPVRPRLLPSHSNFSSVSVMLPPALKTGKLTLVANAMAREVMTNDEGVATGVPTSTRTRGRASGAGEDRGRRRERLRVGAAPAATPSPPAIPPDSPTRAASWQVPDRFDRRERAGSSPS